MMTPGDSFTEVNRLLYCNLQIQTIGFTFVNYICKQKIDFKRFFLVGTFIYLCRK